MKKFLTTAALAAALFAGGSLTASAWAGYAYYNTGDYTGNWMSWRYPCWWHPCGGGYQSYPSYQTYPMQNTYNYGDYGYAMSAATAYSSAVSGPQMVMWQQPMQYGYYGQQYWW